MSQQFVPKTDTSCRSRRSSSGEKFARLARITINATVVPGFGRFAAAALHGQKARNYGLRLRSPIKTRTAAAHCGPVMGRQYPRGRPLYHGNRADTATVCTAPVRIAGVTGPRLSLGGASDGQL
jgi:hypothetical protein